MVDKVIKREPNVIDFLTFQQERKDTGGKAMALSANCCRHCGAALYEGESEDDCSSAGLSAALPMLRDPRRKFYAE